MKQRNTSWDLRTNERWEVVLLVILVAAVAFVAGWCFCISICLCSTSCSKDLCSAADWPDYRISAVSDCLTPLSQAKAPILFLAMGIYIIQILPVAKIGNKIII